MGTFKTIGKAALIGIGAGLGSSIGAITDENSGRGAITGGMIGGAAGMMAMPAMMGVGTVGISAAEKLGGGIMNAMSSTATYGEKGVASNIVGTALGGMGTFAGGIVSGFGTDSALATLGSPIQRHLNGAKGFAEKLVNWDADANTLRKAKFTKFGIGVIAGAGIIEGMAGAKNELIKGHMGQIDPYTHTATPQIPAYQQNAGATGDLVFALNRNRRG